MVLRLAVVGVGWAGTRQIEAIPRLGRKVSVECLVDADAALLQEKSAALGVGRTSTDLKAALANPDVDAVSICLPTPCTPAALRPSRPASTCWSRSRWRRQSRRQRG